MSKSHVPEREAAIGYTAGPWAVEIGRGGFPQITAGIRNIADLASKDLDDLANARAIANLPDALEALDNVTASLESCLAHYADQMPVADRRGRTQVVAAARAILARAGYRA